jgi:two-component sensor histidine kinase
MAHAPVTRPQRYARHVVGEADQLADARWESRPYAYAHVTLARSLRAAAQARAWASAEPAGAIAEAEREAVMLALSELVTNAVRHGAGPEGSTVRVHLGVASRCLRLEVHDDGDGFIAGAIPRVVDDGPGGRGLMIVDALVSRWGAHGNGHGHCVWLEIDR